MPPPPCPHCGAVNTPGISFCTSCGKALPALHPTGPRVVSSGDLPTTQAARNLMTGQLQKQTRKAAWALLAVAIVQTVVGPLQLLYLKQQMEASHPGMRYTIYPRAYLIIFGIAAIFWGLFAWARKSPLPAAIVGLATYITFQVVDAVFDPSDLAKGWLIKGVVIAALVQAISAGVKSRKLESPTVFGS